MSSVLALARPEIAALEPYQHAKWDPSLTRLHANENPWRVRGDATRGGLNRYPEPQPHELIERLATLYGVAPPQVLAGRGSDEGIDLLVRGFCRAGQDGVMLFPPTFGMYKVATRIQGATVVEVPLLRERGFQLDEAALDARWVPGTKLVFFCSPNNPTGNLVDAGVIERTLERLGWTGHRGRGRGLHRVLAREFAEGLAPAVPEPCAAAHAVEGIRARWRALRGGAAVKDRWKKARPGRAASSVERPGQPSLIPGSPVRRARSAPHARRSTDRIQR